MKTPARSIITCDASSLAGLPPGQYGEWGTELEVLPGGKVVVPGTPFLAGSGVFTDTCIGRRHAGRGRCAGGCDRHGQRRLRELLGLPAWELTPGCATPLMLFDWEPGGAFVVGEVAY